MAYSKQTWATGNIITAEKLNHMEDGVANSIQLPENAFLIHITLDPDEEYISDKTFQEALSAYNNLQPIYAEIDTAGTFYLDALDDSNGNIVAFQYTQIISLDIENHRIYYMFLGISEEDNETYVFYTATFGVYLSANLPGTNGTYVLKATRTNSGVSYSWVAE